MSVAVVGRASVSRTFLYANPDAQSAVAEAIRQAGDQRSRLVVETDNSRELTWRERALNAKDAFKAAHTESIAQRTRIGEFLGRMRDLEAEWPQDAVVQITTETPPSNNVCASSAPTTAHSTNDSKAARSNLRFQDRRIADLEARLTESTNPTMSTFR